MIVVTVFIVLLAVVTVFIVLLAVVIVFIVLLAVAIVFIVLPTQEAPVSNSEHKTLSLGWAW